MRDLKQVYRTMTKQLGEHKLSDLEASWGNKYPLVIKSWRVNWEELSAFFKYPEEIRRIIYTTNVIEGFHRQIRKVTETKGAFFNETSLLKLIYLAIQNISKKWTMPPKNWSQLISQLSVFFEGRLKLDLRV
jgi:transposase-like protein